MHVTVLRGFNFMGSYFLLRQLLYCFQIDILSYGFMLWIQYKLQYTRVKPYKKCTQNAYRASSVDDLAEMCLPRYKSSHSFFGAPKAPLYCFHFRYSYGFMFVMNYVCMYVCMYVCTYVYFGNSRWWRLRSLLYKARNHQCSHFAVY